MCCGQRRSNGQSLLARSPFRPLAHSPRFSRQPALSRYVPRPLNGRVAERLKAPDSKSGVRETVPWVQIPPLPPQHQGLTQIQDRRKSQPAVDWSREGHAKNLSSAQTLNECDVDAIVEIASDEDLFESHSKPGACLNAPPANKCAPQ
jgi:hypothetical protein